MEQNIPVRKIVNGIIGLIIIFVLLGSFTIVSAGERGIILRLGSVSRIVSDGLHLKFPLIESVKKLSIQTLKEQVEATAASQDLQNVNTTVAVNYSLAPEKVGELWKSIGEDYKTRVMDPAIQEAIKAATAKHTAEQLITKREEVRSEIESLLKDKLASQYILVSSVSIVNFSFSQQFDSAIEAKVTAEQNALAAKNKLDQVKYEAEQRVSQAEGEAKAIKIQAEAIQNQGGAAYVRLKTIEKWDGKLPVNLYGSAPIPFLNLNQ